MTTNVVDIDLARLIPTALNPRKVDVGSTELTALAESIKAQGQLQPGIAREFPDRPGLFELLAGARRYQACRMAGLDTMRVEVRELTDAEAMAVVIAENLFRANLSPLEEAAGIADLIRLGHNVKTAAALLGRPASWVARRNRLNALAECWASYAASTFGLSVHAMEIIARYGATQQETLFANRPEGRLLLRGTVAEVEGWASQIHRDLSLATWDLADPTLCPTAGACVDCPKRSGAQPLLFDLPVRKGQEVDECHDAGCWEAKKAAQEARGSVFERRKASEPSQKVKTPTLGDKGPSRPSERQPVEELRANLTRRRQARALELLREKLGECCYQTDAETLSLVAAFGTMECFTEPCAAQWDDVKLEKRQSLWESVLAVISERITISKSDQLPDAIEESKRVADYFRLDWSACLAEATRLLPEPAAWSNGIPTQNLKNEKGGGK